MTSCYYFDGATDPNGLPCNHTAVELGQHSSCCAVGDGCLANGLCKTKFEGKWAPTNYYWRGGCTDRTFSDPVCANYCRSDKRTGQVIWQCKEPDSWCCHTGDPGEASDRARQNNYTCCDIDDLKFSAQEGGIWTTAASLTITLPSGPSSSSTSLPDSSPTTTQIDSSVSTQPATQSDSSESINTAARSAALEPTTTPKSSSNSSPNNLAVGLGVGLGVAILVIVGIIGLIIWKRRAKKNKDLAPEYRPTVVYAHNGGQISSYRHLNNGIPIEISTNNRTLELEAHNHSTGK